jgi:hypothetical protein
MMPLFGKQNSLTHPMHFIATFGKEVMANG